ncbi:hypothetical protein TWF225_007058 [Orbilia oligospora]|uniref:Uncharacterized protein n=1 Tax=Orbilia oligospora TaxID=2813651 RepID=A0A8H2E771_ORBOL|nr:hypothetical protein TWF225_007058 [Orbilia oligospora]KAF3248935.1 hypothetical protein TWF128_008005 [Orbilia oligospora]KAF3272583.1 hypothetical protein TWF217_000072 [Orbilia oligospora]TGJ73735.1 hypothetical protein EYR41_000810 [Orbilia oligospora]
MYMFVLTSMSLIQTNRDIEITLITKCLTRLAAVNCYMYQTHPHINVLFVGFVRYLGFLTSSSGLFLKIVKEKKKKRGKKTVHTSLSLEFSVTQARVPSRIIKEK